MSHSRVYFIHALSPLHAGVGQGAGVIDLPIAREKATGLPILPGSSIKGVLRAGKPRSESNQVKVVFGPSTDDNPSEHAGAVGIGDARLLCLPIRSIHGTFAYATSPLVLQRLARDLGTVAPATVFPFINTVDAHVTRESVLVEPGTPRKVYLEDLDLSVPAAADTSVLSNQWADTLAQHLFSSDDAWKLIFRERFIVVRDELFVFLYETALEVCARIRIENETKTVAKGALWYEEALPAESILWGMAMADTPARPNGTGLDTAEAALGYALPVGELRTQMGGKATVGRGLVRVLSA